MESIQTAILSIVSNLSNGIGIKDASIGADKDVTSSLLSTTVDFISNGIINFNDEQYIKTQFIDMKTLKQMIWKMNKTFDEIINYVIEAITKSATNVLLIKLLGNDI